MRTASMSPGSPAAIVLLSSMRRFNNCIQALDRPQSCVAVPELEAVS